MIAGFSEREYTPEEGMIPGAIKVRYGKGKRTPLMAPDAVQESGCYEGTYSNVAYTGHGTENVLVSGATNMLNALFEIDNTVSFGGFRNKPLS